MQPQKQPAAPIMLAAYDDTPGSPPLPPTDAQVLALAHRAQADLPEKWAAAVEVLCRRLVFERSLLAAAADYIPAEAEAEDDPNAPPGWVVYTGDTLRAAGRPKSAASKPHWALTVNPHDPAARDVCDDARIGAMARGLERAFKERLAAAVAALSSTQEREDAVDGGLLFSWPRAEDGVTLEASLQVGLADGQLTGPAASRMEKAGLVEWRGGRATLTERGQRAGQLHARLHIATMDEVQAEAADTLATREV